MPHLLALDQGTTSSRAIVFDDAGTVVAMRQREFKQHFPQPGWVEHDASEIWNTQLGVAVEALGAAKLKPADVAAIGITNQRETVVAWDRTTGEPLHRAIVWQDRRTAADCERLRADGREPMLHAKTGLIADPYFSGTKIAWLLENAPAVRDAANAGRLAVRHDRLVARVEAHGRRAAHHRCVERLADAAHEHPRGRLGRRAARAVGRAAGGAAGNSGFERGVWRSGGALAARGDPHRGDCRRPAGGAVRPGLLPARLGEEHLRHGLLPA